MNNKKYLHISQHWGSLRSIEKDGKVVMYNPLREEGKTSLTNLGDLQKLIEFHNWDDNGVYYSFSDKKDSNWGQETYLLKEDGSLILIGSDYDTSD